MSHEGVKAVARGNLLCYTHADFRAQPAGWGNTALRPGPAGVLGAISIGRVDVSEPASISTGIAERYARAVFELAREGKSIKALEADIAALEAALGDSTDLVSLISSPLHTRAQQRLAVSALAEKMALSDIMKNALALKASKRRLNVLPQFLAALRRLAAEEKGEVTAEVTAARALTKAQQQKLAKALKASVGKNVNIDLAVDESLIGGLVVKVGSKMIDTTIASRLSNLQNAMKEVG